MTSACEHLDPDIHVDSPLDVCSVCVTMGGTWVNLRQCLACGQTGCCNDSPNRHATAHHHETGHPMIRTAQPGQDWLWCYEDGLTYVPGAAGYEVVGD